MSGRRQRLLSVGFLVVGVALLVGLVARQDLAQLGARLVQVGGYFVASFGFYVLGLLVTAYAWKRIIDPRASRAGYGALLGALWAGHAVNQITPTASFGEVLKSTILEGRVETRERIASLVSFNFLSTLVVQLFTLLGPAVCLFALDLPVGVILALFGLALLFLLPMLVVFLLLRAGLTAWLVRVAARLPLVRLRDPEATCRRAQEIDQRIRALGRERPRDLAAALVAFFIVRLLQVGEVWMLLVPLLPERDPTFVLLLSVLTQTSTQIVSWVMTFVPGQVGVAEGGSALLFELLGLDPVIGLSMELLRRVRKIVGIATGLAIGSWLGAGQWRRAAAKRREEA